MVARRVRWQTQVQQPCLERTFRTSIAGEEIFARAWTAEDSHVPRVPYVPRVPAIVMIHGIAVSSRYMVPLARRLAAERDVYAIDLPGFGRSSKPKEPWSIERLADATASWIDANGLAPAILLGNSNGCQVAVNLAARRPALAAALVLNSPTIDDAHRTMLGEIGRLLLDAPRERLSIIPLNVRDYLRTGPRRALGTLRLALDDRIEETIQRVPAPILIVRGERDPIVSESWVRKLASLAPDASVVTLPGVPHAANYSAADAFAQVIGPFLSGSRYGM